MIPTNKQKRQARNRVIRHLLFFDGLLRLVAPITFPFAYLLRWMGKWNPLWVCLEDDTDHLGVPQERIQWTKIKFIVAWWECGFRNIFDNWQSLLKLEGEMKDLWFEYCETWLYDRQGNIKFIDDTENGSMLRAKFYNDPANPSDVHNVGKYLNFDLSYFGKKKYYFQKNGRWYVLYSKCWIKSYSKGVYTIKERNYGASDRILFRRKTQHARNVNYII